jgi:hypothetical protein
MSKMRMKLAAVPALALIVCLSGCGSDFEMETGFESDVAACMRAGGSHLACEQQARDVTCVRAGSRYGEHANDDVIRYRCSDGTYSSK